MVWGLPRCVSRGDRDIGVAFQSHPVGHASSRVEAKDSTILSSRNALLLEPNEWPKGSQAPGFDPWVGKIPWRRAWQLPSVFLPGKSPGQRSLAGYSLGMLGQGSPIFHSSLKGELGIALETLQGQIDLI